jgi:septal ring factor EnvC (AmiA/AmiB activator)
MTAEPPGGDEQDRVEALLRVNAELAAEIRNLNLSRTAAPRSAVSPAVRKLSKLMAERDSLAAELEQTKAELEAARQHSEELRGQIADQSKRIEVLSAEVVRLRSGTSGFLRRIRARLLGPRAGRRGG